MRVLLVEDDAVLRDGLGRSLEAAGYAVDRAQDGSRADALARVNDYDLIILDLGLPDLDGTLVLRRLRQRGCRSPVLILSARDAVEARLEGFDLGADDYLIKPFDLGELEARVRALIRRGQFGSAPRLSHGQLSLDTAARRAYVGDTPLELSAREVALLEAFLLGAGRVVSKEHLATRMYGPGEDVGANAIEVFVHRLRRKIEHAGVVIRTVRGLGYLLERPDGD